ncbi:hypothetical protein K457DRAFT_1831680 [Linnemannia elongata AG-77]|uniref:Uncharacterized protein n=1 Tax=Linnemannia elongata AG-77 TaxID=1314771 RepID=A0A197JYJ9_9FUNG|nr:hypothetical protein K457DRAFT_1831680 [Linnemannia elongata AG-77]
MGKGKREVRTSTSQRHEVTGGVGRPIKRVGDSCACRRCKREHLRCCIDDDDDDDDECESVNGG